MTIWLSSEHRLCEDRGMMRPNLSISILTQTRGSVFSHGDTSVFHVATFYWKPPEKTGKKMCLLVDINFHSLLARPACLVKPLFKCMALSLLASNPKLTLMSSGWQPIITSPSLRSKAVQAWCATDISKTASTSITGLIEAQTALFFQFGEKKNNPLWAAWCKRHWE